MASPIQFSAPRDDNGVPALVGTSSTDVTQGVLVYVDPTTHALYVTAPQVTALNATTPAGTYEASRIIKASAGKLFGMTGYNSKGSTQFIQLFDSATLPPDGAFPKVVFTVSAVSNFTIDYSSVGRQFSAGIVVCNSSTGATKTIGSADCFFDAQYL